MNITGDGALALNIATIAVLSFGLTILLLSATTPAIFRFFPRFAARARQKLLWNIVLTPWLSMVAAAGLLVLPEFILNTPNWFTARFHWHHSLTFNVMSWHGAVSMLAFIFLGAKITGTVFKAIRYSFHVKQLRYFSESDGAQRVIIDSEALHAFTAGWFKPQIYLSKGLFSALSPKELDLVIKHEAAHARRFDPLLILLFSWLATFFPAFVSRRMNQWMIISTEQIADESALTDSLDKFELAKMIIKITRLFRAENERPTRNLCAFTGSSLEMRITYLFDQTNTPPFLTSSAISIAVAFLLMSVYLVDWLHHTIELFLLH